MLWSRSRSGLKRPPMTCDWIVQVGFLPGVTDNVGRTAARALEDIAHHPFQGEVYTSSLYLLRGALPRRDVERIVRDVLANPLIQQWRITAGRGLAALSPTFSSPCRRAGQTAAGAYHLAGARR